MKTNNKKLERNGDENDDTCCDCDVDDDEIMIELWIWDDFKWYLFTVSISSMLFENIFFQFHVTLSPNSSEAA